MASHLRFNELKLDVIKFGEQIVSNKPDGKKLVLLIGGSASAYVLFKVVRFWLKKRKYEHIPGPSTEPGWLGFFTGNISEIHREIKNGKVLADMLTKWHETYGEVFKFQMYDKICVVTSDKNMIKEALVVKNFPKQESIDERIGFPLGERFLGIGILTELDNEKWKHRRAIFNPGFHRHVLLTFVDHFNQIVANLSDKFRSKADGKTPINFLNEVNRATLDAIALIAFGMNTEAINSVESPLNAYLTESLAMTTEYFLDPFIKFKPSRKNDVKEFRKKTRYLRQLGRERILERIRGFKNNEHFPDDILASILSSYQGDDLDIEAMTDDFLTFFVAGQETTANALAFCMLEMGKNPEIVRKAREEIDRVLGERTLVTYQDVAELKYCAAIFKESLRLYPPAASLSRSVPEKTSINGIEIPKDTFLWISTYMNARCEKFFPNPLEFRPERFLKSAETTDYSKKYSRNDTTYVYLPFSLGPRNCIGQNFAQLEGVIVLAKLLQQFDFRLDPSQSFGIVQKLTLRPKDGARCFLTLRSK